jgi:PAS domain S-box-containing protein
MSTRLSIPLSTIFVPLIAIFAILFICGGLYLREADQIKKSALDREARRTEIFAHFFEQDIRSVMKDLQQMVDGDGLQAYLLSGKQDDLNRAIHRAWFFSVQNPDYDQVRYLDVEGKEVLRINWNGKIVPPNQLQNKADRPYFQKANVLAPGQFFISALDLNVEEGHIEQPFKPMLRVAEPVFDSAGKRRGIYIVNYLAANSIERLRQFSPEYQQRLRFLNAAGYWIAAAEPGQEWGFMLTERAGMTLARTDPALWAQISSQPAGQMPHAGGFFTWYRIVPRTLGVGPSDTVVADDDFLVMASEISPAEYSAYLASLRQTFSIVVGVLLVLVAISWRTFRLRQHAQRELDRFFILTRDMLCIAGFDGYFKRVNPAWVSSLGYSGDELLSKPFMEFVHPDDHPKTVAESGRLMRGEETTSFENRYRCKDGSYRWFLWSARSLTNERLIFASARDLTERKQMEEILRQSEERNRSIIERAYDAFISIDAEGRIQDWNLQAESIFGWPREDVLGRFLYETIIPPQYREDYQRGLRRLKATGEGPVLNKRIELTALRRNGEEFPVELAIWPLQVGNETTYHAFARDIASRKEAEERIQKMNKEMKNRAEQLEEANRELEAFSYSVSHDLRSPLRHIHGFVELLQTSPAIQAEESSRRRMNIITRATKEMGMLIDDLLLFSRTGRIEMHPTKVDMRDLLDQAIRELEPETRERKVVWDIKPLPMVSGDANLLRLVWVNLVSNALKYTRPRDEARIEIGHLAGDISNGHETAFYIRDNGVGFDMTYASKLFGVFQRLHRTEDFEGTGIGLANVQRTIHRHGGRVWAESQVNSGATFYFSLPLTPNPQTTPT